MRVLLLVFLLSMPVMAQELVMDTLFSPVGTDRSDQQILALKARFPAAIKTAGSDFQTLLRATVASLSE